MDALGIGFETEGKFIIVNCLLEEGEYSFKFGQTTPKSHILSLVPSLIDSQRRAKKNSEKKAVK